MEWCNWYFRMRQFCTVAELSGLFKVITGKSWEAISRDLSYFFPSIYSIKIALALKHTTLKVFILVPFVTPIQTWFWIPTIFLTSLITYSREFHNITAHFTGIFVLSLFKFYYMRYAFGGKTQVGCGNLVFLLKRKFYFAKFCSLALEIWLKSWNQFILCCLLLFLNGHLEFKSIMTEC